MLSPTFISYFWEVFILLNAISQIICVIIPTLISVAFFTLVERKVLGAIQRRRGPSIVGFFGSLQPFADGAKLFFKEVIIPLRSDYNIFGFSPVFTFLISILGWGVFPYSPFYNLFELNLSILWLYALSSLGIYGIIFAGWASNSKYAFLGGLRSAAQMISYEVSLGLLFLTIILTTKSLNLTEILLKQESFCFIIPLFPVAILFFISMLAETNRAPFDLPEAEAELVSGYNVEYSSMGFALFFIAEYSNILLVSSVYSLFFFGSWFLFNLPLNLPEEVFFSFKVFIVSFLFVWVRASFPRFRYDQLMQIGWKFFLPLILGYIFYIAVLLYIFEVYLIISFNLSLESFILFQEGLKKLI